MSARIPFGLLTLPDCCLTSRVSQSDLTAFEGGWTVLICRCFVSGLAAAVLVAAACGSFPSREEAGICYPGEHLDDSENCGCEGPCEEAFICEEGMCESLCGDGECDITTNETCATCPEDCGVCPPACGNGLLEEPEECDDGNLLAGDGCGTACVWEPVCGDEVCEAEESCLFCPTDCGICPSACGDGVLEEGEECDDSNTVVGDGCSSDCKVEFACGDDVCDVKFGEDCVSCSTDCGDCPADAGQGR